MEEECLCGQGYGHERIQKTTNKVEITYQFQDPTTMIALQHFSVRIEDQNIPADKLLSEAREQIEQMLDRRDEDVKNMKREMNLGFSRIEVH